MLLTKFRHSHFMSLLQHDQSYFDHLAKEKYIVQENEISLILQSRNKFIFYCEYESRHFPKSRRSQQSYIPTCLNNLCK